MSEITTDNKADRVDYDMVIIGGGIYGCTLLWEATHRGLNVLLLEKNDFCAATSANSLKTIHGGIRYLQQLNLKRAIESDREKVILKKIAPNLIQALNCCIADANSISKNTLSYWFACRFFNLLSKLNPSGSGRHKNLYQGASVQKSIQIFNKKYTKGDKTKNNYMVWQDAQTTNSEHLGLAFIRSAELLGGIAHNHQEVTDITPLSSQGYKLTSQSRDQQLSHYQAKTVVDCTGASEFSKAHNLVKDQTLASNFIAGINLILSEQFSDYAFALSSVNKTLNKEGMLFFSPWKNATLAGTWYFYRSELSSKSDVSEEIIENCVTDIQLALSGAGVSIDNKKIRAMVMDVHFGFLPGDCHNDNPEKAIINRAIMADNNSDYFCLQGNKYTTARLNAKKLIDKIAKTNSAIKPSQSHQRVLSGAAIFTGVEAMGPDPVWLVLAERYGDLAPQFKPFLEQINDSLALAPDSQDIYQVEITFFGHQKNVKTLSDLLYRRINRNIHQAINQQTIQWCAKTLSDIKNWTPEELNNNIAEVTELEKNKQTLAQR